MASIANPSTASLVCIFFPVTWVANAITRTCNLRRAEKLWGILSHCGRMCSFKENGKTTERERVSPLTCLAFWDLWFSGADVAPTCQHRLGHSQHKVSKEALEFQSSLWLSCQPLRAWKENEARAQAAWPAFLLDVSLYCKWKLRCAPETKEHLTYSKILWLSRVWCSLATNADMTLPRKQQIWEILVLNRKSRRVKSSTRNRRLSALTFYHFLPPPPDFILV